MEAYPTKYFLEKVEDTIYLRTEFIKVICNNNNTIL